MANPPNNLPTGGKRPRRPGSMPQLPQGDSFWINLGVSVLLLLLLAGAYSYFAGTPEGKPQEIAISQLAQDITAGKVASIIVNGDDLEATYIASTEKLSKKEPESSLTDTLSNYNVPPEALTAVSI